MFLFVFFFDTKTIHFSCIYIDLPFSFSFRKEWLNIISKSSRQQTKEKNIPKISLQFTKWPLCLTKRNKCLETLNA